MSPFTTSEEETTSGEEVAPLTGGGPKDALVHATSKSRALRVITVVAGVAFGFVYLGRSAFVSSGSASDDPYLQADYSLELKHVFEDAADQEYTPPPLPTCVCQGWHGESDGYHGGASADDAEACQRPWGGRYSPCEKPLGNGRCRWGAMKCSQARASATPAPRETAALSERRADSALATALNDSLPCLCVFDVDRTLTARQWSNHGACPNAEGVHGAWDNAYGKGELTLSAAAAKGLSNSSCSKCYVGICSHGVAGNWKEKQVLVDRVLDTAPYKALAAEHPDAKKWSWGIHIPQKSPIVIAVPDRSKQWAVEGILHWYWMKNVSIPRERVWMFDDRQDNADNFAGTGMHSRQISCPSRDWGRGGVVGNCGISQAEIELLPGNYNCHRPPTDGDRRRGRIVEEPESTPEDGSAPSPVIV